MPKNLASIIRAFQELMSGIAAAAEQEEDFTVTDILNTPFTGDETLKGFTAGEVLTFLGMLFGRPDDGICNFVVLITKHPEHRLGMISSLPPEVAATLLHTAGFTLSSLTRE